jgi:hypothetical protein
MSTETAKPTAAEETPDAFKSLQPGRIVMYRDYVGVLHAALVAAVTEKAARGTCRLVVFGALHGDAAAEMAEAARYSENPADLGCWFWPTKK